MSIVRREGLLAIDSRAGVEVSIVRRCVREGAAVTRVCVVSGHALVFGLHHDERKHGAGSIPRATLLVAMNDRVCVKGIELTGADVEGMLAILLRIREKQRAYEKARVDERQETLPLAVESKEPAPANTGPDGKRKKTTAK
jgi:hypothetical protein